MDQALYQQFCTRISQGRKREAKAVLDQFIASADSFDDQQRWVRHWLDNEYNNQKIRHEIYQHLVFPVLLAGYRNHDPWSVYWLARTAQNLYSAPALHAQIDNQSELQLLKAAYLLAPQPAIGKRLLDATIQWFAYCQHEWPHGILYGIDGADLAACAELLEEIAWVTTLDTQQQYRTFLTEFAGRVHAYMQRLRRYEPPTTPT